MGESGDALIRPIVLLVVHVRLACGGEQAVFCGASSRRCTPFVEVRAVDPGYDMIGPPHAATPGMSFSIMQPFTHPPIPNTVIVLVSKNTLAPIVVHVLCLPHHSSDLVLNPGRGQFLHHFLMPDGILGELKVF